MKQTLSCPGSFGQCSDTAPKTLPKTAPFGEPSIIITALPNNEQLSEVNDLSNFYVVREYMLDDFSCGFSFVFAELRVRGFQSS